MTCLPDGLRAFSPFFFLILFLANERLGRCCNSWNDDWGGAYGACCYIIKYKKKSLLKQEGGRGCDYIAQSHPSKSSRARASSFFEWIEKERLGTWHKKKKRNVIQPFPPPTPFTRSNAHPPPIVPDWHVFCCCCCCVCSPFKKKELLNFLVSSLQFKLINTRLLVFIITSRVRWYDVRVSYCCPGKRDVAPALRTFFFKP